MWLPHLLPLPLYLLVLLCNWQPCWPYPWGSPSCSFVSPEDPFISIPFHIAWSLSEVSWYGLCNGDQGGSRTVLFPWEAICIVTPVAGTAGWVPRGHCPVLYHSLSCQTLRVLPIPCPIPTKEREHPCSPDFWLFSEDTPLYQSACLYTHRNGIALLVFWLYAWIMGPSQRGKKVWGLLTAQSVSCSVLASQRSLGVGSKRCLWLASRISLKLTLCLWNVIRSPVGSVGSCHSAEVGGPWTVVVCFIFQLWVFPFTVW